VQDHDRNKQNTANKAQIRSLAVVGSLFCSDYPGAGCLTGLLKGAQGDAADRRSGNYPDDSQVVGHVSINWLGISIPGAGSAGLYKKTRRINFLLFIFFPVVLRDSAGRAPGAFSVVLVPTVQPTGAPSTGNIIAARCHFDAAGLSKRAVRPRWTRWLVALTWLLTVAYLFTFNQDEWVRLTTTRSRIGYAIWGILILLAIGIQLYRYRRIYSQIERQQTKWVLIGIAATFLLSAIFSVPYYYSLNLPPGAAQPWWEPLGSAGWWFTMIILPLSLTISIMRYRLWDIDILIRRTLVYGALTATLALVFFSGVTLLQQVVGRITGTEESPVAIVLSTLAIVVLSIPLRRRIQEFIDRRFYRKKYNAEQALADFAEAARNETDLEALTGKLVEVVSQTMQPERVSLWLKKGKL